MFKDLLRLFISMLGYSVGASAEGRKEQKEKSKLNRKNRYSYSAELVRKAKDARKSMDTDQ